MLELISGTPALKTPIFLGGGGGGGVQTTPDPNTSAKVSDDYRDTNGRRIVIQIGGVCVYTTFCQGGGMLLQKKIAIEMGGVSRCFSKVSGSGVDFTLPNSLRTLTSLNKESRPFFPKR